MDRIGKHFPAPQLFWWLAGQSVRRSLLGATKCRKITAASTFQPLFRSTLMAGHIPILCAAEFSVGPCSPYSPVGRSLQSICPCPFCPWAAGLWPWQSTKGGGNKFPENGWGMDDGPAVSILAKCNILGPEKKQVFASRLLLHTRSERSVCSTGCSSVGLAHRTRAKMSA